MPRSVASEKPLTGPLMVSLAHLLELFELLRCEDRRDALVSFLHQGAHLRRHRVSEALGANVALFQDPMDLLPSAPA